MISTDNLVKKFRRLAAVDHVSLEVPEGAVYALLGPNGAGKSTLLKTLLNVWRPDGGAATVLGVDSRRIGHRELQHIGYVAESQRLPDWMRVSEFLAYCRPFYPQWDDAHAGALARAMGLPLHRRMRELSRGMRLKAALVSALAYRPKVLLLDEPFSGLDVLVRDEISEMLVGEAAGLTILLASHDLADLESFASHVGYIHDGRLLFSEEMPALAERYRGVEVTLEDGFRLPSDWPPNWLNPEHTQRVVRFTDSQFDPEQVSRFFPNAREIHSERLSLRRIFVALARAQRETQNDLANS
jgi:ABC-2 type transport system ATP-binding protein